MGGLSKKAILFRLKGLYIWSGDLATEGYSPEILSNLIYGPSYISPESAMSFHGLIPERVESVMAVTFKKGKTFSSPVGHFEYLHLYKEAYVQGIDLHQINQREACLIASPEKALLDYIALRVKRLKPESILSQLLYDDLRFDQTALEAVKVELPIKYGAFYRSKAVSIFLERVVNGGHNRTNAGGVRLS